VAVLEVDLARLDELFDLLPPQVERHRQIPGRAAVNETVAMTLDLLAERGVSRDMAQLDQRLPLERSSLAFCAVILADLIERVGEGPLAAVGPQSDVDVKNAFLLGFDPLQKFLREAFEVFAVLDPLFAACASGPAVDEEHLDVGGVAHFLAAEFPRAQDRKGTGLSVGQTGAAIELRQFGLAVHEAAFDDHFSQF